MIGQAIDIITTAFAACVSFFDRIVSAVGAAPLIVATLGMLFVVSLFLMPLRGAAIGSFAESTLNHIKASGKQKYKRASGSPNGGIKRLKG